MKARAEGRGVGAMVSDIPILGVAGGTTKKKLAAAVFDLQDGRLLSSLRAEAGGPVAAVALIVAVIVAPYHPEASAAEGIGEAAANTIFEASGGRPVRVAVMAAREASRYFTPR